MADLDTVVDAFSASMGGTVTRAPVIEANPIAAEELFGNTEMEVEPGVGEDDEEDIVEPGRSLVPAERRDPAEVDEFSEEGEIDPPEVDDEPSEPQDKQVVKLDPKSLVTIKVDGKEERVPLQEALDGYTRTKTFHQRLNALNADRQKLTADQAEATARLDKYGALLVDLIKEVDAVKPTEPNWDAEYTANPTEASKKRALWDRYVAERKALNVELERAIKEREQVSAKQLSDFIAGESDKLLAAYPHWSDPEKKARDLAAMRKTASSLGFTPQEIDTVYDSRMVRVLMKAARFDRLSSKKLVPNKSDTKPMRSGSASPGGTVPRGRTRAMREHNRVGTVDSAADVFANVISQEG